MEGWSVDDVKWKGVRLKVLFDKAGLKPEAVQCRAESEFPCDPGSYRRTFFIRFCGMDEVDVQRGFCGIELHRS